MATTAADPEDLARLAAGIARTRERRGLTRGELASRIGMSEQGFRHLERGKTGLSTAMLFRLARVLDCSWNDLLGAPPHGEDPEWQAGYRAGVGDAAMAARALLVSLDETQPR